MEPASGTRFFETLLVRRDGGKWRLAQEQTTVERPERDRDLEDHPTSYDGKRGRHITLGLRLGRFGPRPNRPSAVRVMG